MFLSFGNHHQGDTVSIFFNLRIKHLIRQIRLFISAINQLDAQNFCFTLSLFHASTCFEHMCSSSGGHNCITQPLVSSHLYVWWYQRLCNAIMTSWCILYHHTYRCDDTRGCVMQFWPPNDEHMCSKHVEAWNKLNVKQKFCVSSWLTTEVNNCICLIRCYILRSIKLQGDIVKIVLFMKTF